MRGAVTKALLLGLILAGWAHAQESSPSIPLCAQQPVVLETPQGLIGGGSLDYDGDTAVFGDGACLETNGLSVRAPEIRYFQAEGRLELKDLEAQTARYRFRAREGVVKGKTFEARGIWLTPCRCGEDLLTVSETARFDLETGDLLLGEAKVELFHLTVLRSEELLLDRQALSGSGGLASIFGPSTTAQGMLSPLRIGYDQGLIVGVEELPLPLAPGDLRRGTFNLTLVASGLGGGFSAEKLAFGVGVIRDGQSGSFRMEAGRDSFHFRSRVQDGPFFFTSDTDKQLAEAGMRFGLAWGGLSLSPFARIAQEDVDMDNPDPSHPVVTGLTLGAEARYPLIYRQGAFRLRLEPWATGAVYDRESPPYLALGAEVEGRYDGEFSLQLAYRHSWEARPSRFAYERRGSTRLVSVGVVTPKSPLGSLDLRASYDFAATEAQASLRYGFPTQAGELWLEGRSRIESGLSWQQRELLVGFIPNPPDCAYAFSLSPTLGYDFLRQGFSRAGLEVRYADCCFIWKVGYQAVFIPQNDDETAGGRLSFGLELR
ncbi:MULTISPECIES: hypothetical protein [unclassified Meiothermus]|uniref:hypothetical protein n=1 Tax=unclassified Meiothermus TaxID=370471 RepID=UPI000D7CA194|nr:MULTISPECIES: hypothetical protein [unclassified Meiothermus]PZA08761.1 hypothetical protein DNA98_01575 [Meiothermus sp. Pnk-1]RYM40617.1 hypothetical protein EWH23_00365 [Meiothermus sp. PNK-Is4]